MSPRTSSIVIAVLGTALVALAIFTVIQMNSLDSKISDLEDSTASLESSAASGGENTASEIEDLSAGLKKLRACLPEIQNEINGSLRNRKHICLRRKQLAGFVLLSAGCLSGNRRSGRVAIPLPRVICRALGVGALAMLLAAGVALAAAPAGPRLAVVKLSPKPPRLELLTVDPNGKTRPVRLAGGGCVPGRSVATSRLSRGRRTERGSCSARPSPTETEMAPSRSRGSS